MSADDGIVEIYFRLRRDECPDLFDNLVGVPKGQPRAQRLKVLSIRGFDSERRTLQAVRPPGVPAFADVEPGAPAVDLMGDLLSGRTEE